MNRSSSSTPWTRSRHSIPLEMTRWERWCMASVRRAAVKAQWWRSSRLMAVLKTGQVMLRHDQYELLLFKMFREKDVHICMIENCENSLLFKLSRTRQWISRLFCWESYSRLCCCVLWYLQRFIVTARRQQSEGIYMATANTRILTINMMQLRWDLWVWTRLITVAICRKAFNR